MKNALFYEVLILLFALGFLLIFIFFDCPAVYVVDFYTNFLEKLMRYVFDFGKWFAIIPIPSR